MKRFILLLLCLLLLAACAPAAGEETAPVAATSSLDLSQQDLQPADSQAAYKPLIEALIQKGTLVVGMIAEDRQPFFYHTSEDASMDGLDVEIALGLANTLGVRLEIDRSAKTHQQLLENLAAGRYDLVLAKLSMTPERAMTVSFSTPYVTLKRAFLVNKKQASQLGVAEYPFDQFHQPGVLLGAIGGSSHEAYLRQSFPDADIRTYWGAEAMIRAVIEGDIFAAAYDDISFVQAIMQDYEISIYTSLYTVEDLRDYICAAVPDGSDALLQCVNAYLMVNCYNYVLDDLIRDFPECFN